MTKTTAILVHGSPGTGQSWRGVAEALGEDWNIVAPTLHGYGGEPLEELSVAELADRLIADIGQHDIPDQIVLAGHSFGGVVALEAALSKRLPVAALILFEPVLTTTLDLVGNKAAFNKVNDYFQNYIADFEGGNTGAVEKMISFWFGEGAFQAMPSPVRQYLLDMTAANVRDVKAAFDRQFDLSELAGIDVPVTIAFGTSSPDTVVHIANAVTSVVPRGLKHSIEGGNHAMLAERPAEVAQIIANHRIYVNVD